jgi:hypothetical protein
MKLNGTDIDDGREQITCPCGRTFLRLVEDSDVLGLHVVYRENDAGARPVSVCVCGRELEREGVAA